MHPASGCGGIIQNAAIGTAGCGLACGGAPIVVQQPVVSAAPAPTVVSAAALGQGLLSANGQIVQLGGGLPAVAPHGHHGHHAHCSHSSHKTPYGRAT